MQHAPFKHYIFEHKLNLSIYNYSLLGNGGQFSYFAIYISRRTTIMHKVVPYWYALLDKPCIIMSVFVYVYS